MPDKPPAQIVTTHYRYKPPPKRKQPVALEVPAVVRRGRKSDSVTDVQSDEATAHARDAAARARAIADAMPPSRRIYGG